MRFTNLFKPGVGVLAILAVVVAVGCATQKKKEDKRSPTAGGELGSFGADDDENPTMDALENAAEDAAKDLFAAAQNSDDSKEAELLNTVGKTLEGVAEVADAADGLSGNEVGEICAGLNLTLDALGSDQEAQDPRQSKKWLAWGIVGAALVGGGVFAERSGKKSVENALKTALGDDIDLKLARKAFLDAGSSDADKKRVLQQLKVYAEEEKKFVAEAEKQKIDEAEAKRVYRGLYQVDGDGSPALKGMYEEGGLKGELVDDFKKVGVEGDNVGKFKDILNKKAVAAQKTDFDKAVTALASDEKIGKGVTSANSKLNTWFRTNKLATNAVKGFGATMAAIAIYQLSKDSLSLTDTNEALSADGEAAIERAALMVDSASAGCDAPQPGETI